MYIVNPNPNPNIRPAIQHPAIQRPPIQHPPIQHPNIILVDVGVRDKKVEHLKHVLQQRKQQMLQNYKVCNGCVKQQMPKNDVCRSSNENLMKIVDTYKQYYTEQVTKKKQQLSNMRNINVHLDNMLDHGTLSNSNISKIKDEQSEIFKQLGMLDDEIISLSENI